MLSKAKRLWLFKAIVPRRSRRGIGTGGRPGVSGFLRLHDPGPGWCAEPESGLISSQPSTTLLDLAVNDHFATSLRLQAEERHVLA